MKIAAREIPSVYISPISPSGVHMSCDPKPISTIHRYHPITYNDNAILVSKRANPEIGLKRLMKALGAVQKEHQRLFKQ